MSDGSPEMETSSIVNMSDDDFMALDTPPTQEPEEALDTEDLDSEQNTSEEEDGHEEDSLESDEDDQSDDEGHNSEEEDADDEDLEDEAGAEDVTTDDINPDSTDFEAQIKSLLAPFRANGKDISVTSVDEARTLMQMGANYNKKMAGLKPNLKLMKMLSNNGLLDEGKLNHLIDLDKKDPKAISKLISDANLDPLDIDVSSTADYTANQYTVSDEQMNLDDVLDQIKGTSHYNETVEVVGNTWDKASQEIVVQNPNVITDINNQIADGTFAKVSSEVERQRMLGGLQGFSDIEAYRQVGEQMYAKNAPAQSNVANMSSTTKVIKAKQDPKLNSKKRAAGTTKSTPKDSKDSKDFNPLSMSDDEFEKLLAGGKFA